METSVFEEWEWWWGAWRGIIRCACGALTPHSGLCALCGYDYSAPDPEFLEIEGMKVPARIYAGALDWSPYALLRMMHADWCRPLGDEVGRSGHDPAARAMIVLIFWTYFETLMTWFYERATAALPSAVAADLLGRYSSIGARLDRLHRVLFGTRYTDDLAVAGFQDVAVHIERLQQRAQYLRARRPDGDRRRPRPRNRVDNASLPSGLDHDFQCALRRSPRLTCLRGQGELAREGKPRTSAC